MRKKALILLLILSATASKSQTNIFPATGSTGIGTITPNASSILEMKSTTKGMLVPRMTKVQRDAIATPATGLLIYQTNNTPGFYYYSGAAWTAMSSSAGANTSLSNLTSPTAINAGLAPDSNNFRNLGSSKKGWKDIYASGSIFIGGIKTLNVTGAGNLFIGQYAGASNTTGGANTASGDSALLSNTTGSYNTANGFHSLYANTVGTSNTAMGGFSLERNTTGVNNTAMGHGALAINTNGADNTATGVLALYQTTTGSFNTASGVQALYSNTTGADNVANGYLSLYTNTTGYFNTAIGNQALYSNTTGIENTAVGVKAGYNNISGRYNTCIGTYSGSAANLDNSICIGYSATSGLSNLVSIGNSSISTIGGQVGWSSFSDGRVKDNIKRDVPGLAFINKLNPVTYNFNIHKENEMQMKGRPDTVNWRGKYDIEKKKMTGFIAQEVEKAANDMGYDFSGVVKPPSPDGLYALTYSEFVVPLVKAVQELSKMNDDKDAKINDLETRLSKLEALITAGNQSSAISSEQVVLSSSSELGTASLEQNMPNPFSSKTIIRYTLPQSRNSGTSAQIIITDKTGKALKKFTIPGNGKGVLNVDAAMLSSGTYVYALYVEGKLVASKQMLITH